MGLGRFETWARLGRVRTGETLFNDASLHAEEQEWRTGPDHHTSFHISAFPAGDPRTCDRQAIYRLMGMPNEVPATRMLMGTAIVGTAAEEWNTRNLDLDGRLLSANVDAEHQTKFEDADHWLSGSPDFVVLPPGWNRPHLIETKTKDLDVVVEMKNLQRSYDARHARQTRAYIGIGHAITPQVWPEVVICSRTWRLAYVQPNEQGEIDDISYQCRDHGDPLVPGSCLMRLQLKPLRTGSLVYMGRDRPHVTCEYVFEHDEQWFQSGLDVLTRRQGFFQSRVLPSQPFGGKDWSKDPCRFCDFKKHVCKPDHKAGVTKLEDSHGVAWAKGVYGDYDFDAVMKAVTDRWRGKSGMYAKLPETHQGRGVKAAA